jgi:hypothetical protein
MSNQTDIPILLIGYQRTETISTILDSALRNGVTTVLVSIDAPRTIDARSLENSRKLKDIVSSYSTKFNFMETRFLENNLGCALHVLKSIDWAFERFSELVILEDDCLPSDGFFNFVREGLLVMQSQPEILLVCGTQHVPSHLSDQRYYKSKFALTWGWATTNSKWVEIKSGMIAIKNPAPLHLFELDPKKIYWQEGSRRALDGFVDVWDTPLVNYLYTNEKFSLLPKSNLVSNVGNDSFATHMRGEKKWLFQDVTEFDYSLPVEALLNSAADEWLSHNFYRVRQRHLFTTRITRLRDKFKKSSRSDLISRWLS